MNDYLEAMLNFAFEHGISYTLNGSFSPYTPSGAYPDKKRIVINTNWHRPNQLPYVVAHEISHILHEDAGILYFHTDSSRRSLEAAADATATQLLVSEYHKRNDDVPNYAKFMADFEIPANLEDVVKAQIRNEYM